MQKRTTTISYDVDYCDYDSGDIITTMFANEEMVRFAPYEVESYYPPTSPTSKGFILIRGLAHLVDAAKVMLYSDLQDLLKHGLPESKCLLLEENFLESNEAVATS